MFPRFVLYRVAFKIYGFYNIRKAQVFKTMGGWRLLKYVDGKAFIVWGARPGPQGRGWAAHIINPRAPAGPSIL